MKIALIGDVHGRIDDYNKLIRKLKHRKEADGSLQIGDFGIGFNVDHKIEDHGENHRVFRGNHDSTVKAKESPVFLPDFGVWNGIFYVAGADSIDKQYRVEGQSWWADEEISMEGLQQAIDLFKEVKPKVVASHDCPQRIFDLFGYIPYNRTRTRMALDTMLDHHEPEIWIFGHHHVNKKFSVDGVKTDFRCLAELHSITLDTESF